MNSRFAPDLAEPAMTRSAAAFAAILALSACGDLLIDPFDYGVVDVVATTRSGAPAPAVELTLYSGTRHLGFATTDADGRARFGFVPEGALGVSASPAWFYGVEDPPVHYYTELVIAAGEQRTVELGGFIGPGSLRVEVVLASGSPAVGHAVELYDPSGPVERRVVQGPDPLEFEPLQPGAEYGVRVFAHGSCDLAPGGFVDSGNQVIGEEAVTDVRLVLEGC